jgi:hypothetical protein
MAILAAYLIDGKKEGKLEDYLEKRIFAGQAGTTIQPDPAEVEGFEVFTQHYKDGLAAEKAAVESMHW